MMGQNDVIEVLAALEDAGVEAWVDGGWGVDALVGEQTRDHGDLDLAIPLEAVETAIETLRHLGFRSHEDEMPTRLDLRDGSDRRVDLHPLVFDADGNGLQKLQDGSFGTYFAEGLTGRGRIGELSVRCLSPSLQMRFHVGFEPDEADRHDVQQLSRKFGLPVPEEFGT
jgi:lincosamide nucleotidyltransferase A/C/D/E